MRMNLFDKICAVMAIILGGVFVLLGGLGVFMGCKAHFTLPPILGGIPLLVGWGIIKAILVAWHAGPEKTSGSSHYEGAPESETWE